MINFRLYVTLWVGILLASASFTAQATNRLDRIIASVNQEVITESELNKQTQLFTLRLKQSGTELPPLPTLHKQLLEKMILEKLQLQLATHEGIGVTDAELNDAIAEIASRDNLSTADMRKILEEQGVPFAEFRETIRTEMILSRLQQKEVARNIIVSKTDIEQFLQSPVEHGASSKAPSVERKNEAMEVLYQRKFQEAVVPWLRRLRSNAEIKTYLNGN